MQAPKVAARLVAQDSDHVVAIWHETVITVFHGAASLHQVLNITKVCEALLAEAQGAVTYLGVIERASPAPSETVRRALATWSRDVVPKTALAVIVVEGGGFKSALVRGVSVALTALLPHRVPFKFTGSVEEGAVLVAAFLPHKAGGAAELGLAIAELRQRWEAKRVNGAVG